MAVAEGLEPSISGLTIRRLTNLATPQRRIWWTGRDSNPHKKFAGLLCSRLHHQPGNIVDCQLPISDWLWTKSNPSLPINRQLAIANRQSFGGCGWSRTTNLALMRRLL